MSNPDTCCSLEPYFKIHEGKIDEFKDISRQFIETTESEPGCMYYAFSFDGDNAYCREGYVDADALLTHVDHVGHLIEAALKISDMSRLEIHGPEAEVDKLRAPLAELSPQFFTLIGGFRR